MKLIIAVLLLLASPLAAQTIAPSQIKPGANGQSLQTVGGKAAWANNSTSVSTVFGRTGDILPVTGDYNCAQITSAICSLPSLFNQTVQVDGAPATQRAKLNFINGSAGTVSCVDNPVTLATDCTFTGGSTTGPVYSISNVAGSHSVYNGTCSTAYQNTTSNPMFVGGSIGTSGSGTGNILVAQAPSCGGPYTLVPWANQATATVSGGDAGFSATIYPGYFYIVQVSGAVNGGVRHWTEITSTGSGGGGGGGGGFTAGGDLSGTSVSQQVIGLKNIPFCSGFSPTNGQFLELTTGGSPNPCWTAAAAGGGGTPGGSNHAMQYNSAGSFAGALFNGIPKLSTTADPTVISPTLCSSGLVPNGIDVNGNSANCQSIPTVLGYTPAQAANLIASPLLRYDMLHVSGTTLTDSSGNGNNGTLVGSTLPVANSTNLFFAQSSAVQMPPAANSARTWYVTTFVTPTLNQTIAQSAPFQSLINSSLGSGVGINLLSRGENLGYSLYNSSFPTACYALTTGYVTYALTLGTNSSTDPDRLYINGQECGTYQSQGASSGAQISGNLFLGSSASGVFANSSNIGPWYWAEAFSVAHTPAQVLTESTNINNIVAARGVQTAPLPLNLGLPQLMGGLDSITGGAGSTSGHDGWMSYLSLTSQPSYTLVNFGIGGDTLLRALSDAPYRDAPQCTAVRGPNIFVVLAGINDLSGFSPSQVYGELNRYVGILKAAGCRVYVGTIIDNGNTGFGGASLSSLKNTYDQLILTGWKTTGADGVIDFADIPCLGADGSAGGACFNNLVHPNDTGYTLMGAAASNKLNYDFGYNDLNPHNLAATGAYTMAAGDGTLNIASASATTPLTMPSCIGQTGAVYHINNQQAVNTVTVVGSLSSQPINGSTSAVTIPSNTSLYLTDTRNSTAVGGCYWVASPTGTGGGSPTVIQVNGTPTSTTTPVNLQTSTANSVGLTVTPSNPSAGNVKLEVTGGSYSGTAANLSGTPALPNGTTATTQTAGDNTTKLATDAFVTTAVASAPTGISGATIAQALIAGSATTATSSKPIAGSGSGLTTGPTSGVTSGDVISASGTTGQVADSGIAAADLARLSANQTFTGVKHFQGSLTPAFFGSSDQAFFDASGDLSVIQLTTADLVTFAGAGTNPGQTGWVGNTSAPSVPNNRATLLGPNAATFTGYALQWPTTGPSGGGQTLQIGAPTSGISQVSFVAGALHVANGTLALGTSAIASGACATAVTTTATGTATTDVVGWGFNGDPTAVTGYSPTTNGMLTIIAYPSSGNVNFKVCNNTSASVTPGAITLNWSVIR